VGTCTGGGAGVESQSKDRRYVNLGNGLQRSRNLNIGVTYEQLLSSARNGALLNSLSTKSGEPHYAPFGSGAGRSDSPCGHNLV
jgi:hypothetical protein